MAPAYDAFDREFYTVGGVVAALVGWYFVREGLPGWHTLWPLCLKIAYAAAVHLLGPERDHREAIAAQRETDILWHRHFPEQRRRKEVHQSPRERCR